VIPNGIDPRDLQPQTRLSFGRLRLEFADPDQKLVPAGRALVYEKGFQLALEAMPGVIERVPGTASWSPDRAPTRPSCVAGGGLG